MKRLGAATPWWAWLAGLVLSGGLVARYGTPAPFWDEWSLFPQIVREAPVTARWLLTPVVEHQMPLTKLVLLGVVRAAGLDFRAGMLLSTALLAAIAGLLIATCRRLRGEASASDAFLPLCLLSTGQYENLLWSFQLQFVLPVFLFGLVLAGVALGFAASPRGRAGLLLALGPLPFTDPAGAILAAPVCAWLVLHRRHGVRAGERVLAALALFACGLPFVRWSHPALVPPLEAGGAPRTLAELLGGAFGPSFHGAWAATALVVTCVLVWTVRVLMRGGPDGHGLSACLLGAAGLLGAVALARGSFGPGAGLASRYTTLAAPLLIVVYVASLAGGGPRTAHFIPAGLLLAVLLATPGNLTAARDAGTARQRAWRAFVADVERGLPLAVVAARNAKVLFQQDSRIVPDLLRGLERNQLAPFRGQSVQLPTQVPASREERVELEPQVRGAAWIGNRWRATSSDPSLELRLSPARFLNGIRLDLEVVPERGHPVWMHFWWAPEPNQAFTWLERGATAFFAAPAAVREVHTVWIYDTVARFRFDPHTGRCEFAVRGVRLLLPADGAAGPQR